MNDTLAKTLDRILQAASDKALLEEMRGGPTYRPSCKKCDATGWELVTAGKVTTAGGREVQASEACPVARRCPAGCVPPVPNNRKAKKDAEAPRSSFGGD